MRFPPFLAGAWGATALLLVSCAGPARSVAPNTLTPAQANAGWRLLFDGTTQAWRGFNQPGFPAQGWAVDDGWLHHLPKGGGGDLITREKFTDFDLEFDWRIAVGANSGVKYFIDEQRGSAIGHEYQLIDDAVHPDAAHGANRQTASLYDALAPDHAPVQPAGAINHSRIVVRGQHVEHWLNGRRVVSYELGSPELATAKATSKFKGEARWGTKFPTPILLQDHGDEIWFRNLRIRALPGS